MVFEFEVKGWDFADFAKFDVFSIVFAERNIVGLRLGNAKEQVFTQRLDGLDAFGDLLFFFFDFSGTLLKLFHFGLEFSFFLVGGFFHFACDLADLLAHLIFLSGKRLLSGEELAVFVIKLDQCVDIDADVLVGSGFAVFVRVTAEIFDIDHNEGILTAKSGCSEPSGGGE